MTNALIERLANLDGRSTEAKAIKVQIEAANAADAASGTAEAKAEDSKDYIERVNAPVVVETPLVDMVGGTKGEWFSKPLTQVEQFLMHLEANNPEIGRSTDGITNYTSIIPIDSSSPLLKCHYARTEAWNITDGRVATLPFSVHWLQRPDTWQVVDYADMKQNVPLNMVHSMLEGYAHTNSAWVSDDPDTSAQGKHSKQFLANASRFFTEDSFYSQDEIDADSNISNNSIRRLKLEPELNEWVIERIVSFKWNPEAFRLEREAKEATTRTNTPTATIACEEHHWSLDPAERDSKNTVRAKLDAEPVACFNSDHYELLLRAAVAARAVDVGNNDVDGAFDALIADIPNRLPKYIVEPKE